LKELFKFTFFNHEQRLLLNSFNQELKKIVWVRFQIIIIIIVI